MNIGIDLDGVLFDTENYYRVLAMIYDVENNGLGEINKEELHFQDRFGWSDEKAHKFISENLLEILENSQFMPYAKFVIEKFKKMGHKLYVVTARGGYGFPEEIEVTNRRLKEEGIEFDGYFYSSLDKVTVCKNAKIDIMIDDYYNNVEKLADAGIKCLYYRDLVLKFFNDNPFVHEVRNWGDIYKEIVKFGDWK